MYNVKRLCLLVFFDGILTLANPIHGINQDLTKDSSSEPHQNNNIDCEIISNFLNDNHSQSPNSLIKKQTQDFIKEKDLCWNKINSEFKNSNDLEVFFHKTVPLSCEMSNNFFSKCIDEKKPDMKEEKKKELIFNFYFHTFNLRNDLLKSIENHSSFSRLQGNTSFFKSRPYPNNLFQKEQIQRIDDLSKCPTKNSYAYDLASELHKVIEAIAKFNLVPQQIYKTYPILNEKEFIKLLSLNKASFDQVGKALMEFLDRSTQKNLSSFEINQLLLQCLYDQDTNEKCKKKISTTNTNELSTLLFQESISKNNQLSLSCGAPPSKEEFDSCLSKINQKEKPLDCDVSIMPKSERDYRICKMNALLAQEKLDPITINDSESTDKNILSHKKPIMGQKWSNLLFLHYKVDPKELEKLIPSPLELDLHKNEAWVSVVPFKMSEVKPGNVTNVISSFPEINVRTYVKYGDQRGIYFLTLDASNKLVVKGSGLFPGLPYKQAKMTQSGEGTKENPYYIKSNRTEKNAPAAQFEGTYEVSSENPSSIKEDLNKFLVERYRFFGVNQNGCVVKTDIDHAKWPIKSASANIKQNTLLDSIPQIKFLNSKPLVNYVEEMDVQVWAPKEIGCEKIKN